MDTEIYPDEHLLAELHSLKESINRIADFILEMKRGYSVLDEKIELNSADVIRLLGISRASLARWPVGPLARWRNARAIPFRYVSSNHVVYPFKGLYIAVKTGRASFKGFRRVEALQRLNAYKDGILKGYMGDSKIPFEEL